MCLQLQSKKLCSSTDSPGDLLSDGNMTEFNIALQTISGCYAIETACVWGASVLKLLTMVTVRRCAESLLFCKPQRRSEQQQCHMVVPADGRSRK